MTGERRFRSLRHLLVAWSAGLLFVCFAGGADAFARQVPRVECTLARDTVFEGEPVDYTIAVLDAEASPPDLSEFAEFDVAPIDSQSIHSSQLSIVNGRRLRVDRVGIEYRYQLAPKLRGTLTVPGATVIADGKTFRGNTLTLTVTAPDDQGRLRLMLEVTPKECYPQRPVVLRLAIAVRRPDGDPQDRDPVLLLSQLESPEPPMLRLPWLDFPTGLGADDWVAWLQPQQIRGGRGGFAINEKPVQGGVPLFLFNDRPRYAQFDLGGRRATSADAPLLDGLKGAPGEWYVYSLERRFTPTQCGRFDFAPASLKGRFIASLDGRRANLDDLFTRSGAADLVVREPPAEGRPEGWRNAIGAFKLAADISPRTARVGDPLTLTLRITGNGNLDELVAPDLAVLPSFTAAFRVHPGTAESRDGARLLTWSLRPLAATTREVPPIPFPWFDPEKSRWIETATPPLAIEVSEAIALDPGAIVAAPKAPRAGAELAAQQGGVFAHDSDPRSLGDERADWRAHALFSASLPLATLALLGAHGAWIRRRADPRAQRRRKALGRARERCALAERSGGEALSVARDLRAALLGFVADLVDGREEALTAREAMEALVAAGVDATRTNSLKSVLDELEALRFGGTPPPVAALSVQARGQLDTLAAALARNGARR
ncbi:MAG: hypothetical protein EXS13_04720 [Planctomycetes bacterium]|nr:hypothetical protein [Planctomycetota bacterium]